MLYDKRWDAKPKKIVANEPWRRLLNDAADLIECDGWCQFNLHRGAQSCAIGAMWRVANPGPDFHVAVERLTIYLGLSKSPIALPDWNNAPERTQAEVVAAFRGCAREP